MAGKAGYWLPFYDAVSHGRSVKRIDSALLGLCIVGVAFIGLGIWLESFPELMEPGYVFIGLGIFGMVITFSKFFWHRQNTPETPDQSS